MLAGVGLMMVCCSSSLVMMMGGEETPAAAAGAGAGADDDDAADCSVAQTDWINGNMKSKGFSQGQGEQFTEV